MKSLTKAELGIIVSSISLVGGIVIGIVTRQRWWFYILVIFILAPALGSVGYVLGEEPEEKLSHLRSPNDVQDD